MRVKQVSFNKKNQTYLVKYHEDVQGEISLDNLGIASMNRELILDRPLINKNRNGFVLWNKAGGLVEINLQALNHLLTASNMTQDAVEPES